MEAPWLQLHRGLQHLHPWSLGQLTTENNLDYLNHMRHTRHATHKDDARYR
jgi:hypothetical protein